MHRDRLQKLIDHMTHNVKDEHFDMSTWVGSDRKPWGGKADLSCGTTACVMGHAASIPEFQALGLELRPLQKFTQLDRQEGCVWFNDFSGTDAAGQFLDIGEREAAYLFLPNYYPVPDRKHVIQRLTDFLNGTMEIDY